MKKISKVLLLVIVAVAFCFGITGQQVQARDTSIIYGDGTITRAEWLHDLTVMFDMTVEKDNMPDDYFSDVTSTHTYYKDIMMAAEFGVIDIEAGQKVKPDEAATREFAAHTLNYCLGYKLEDKTYTYKDTTGIKYPDDTQIAINRGWFALESGRFNPEKTITKSEIENMVSDAKTVQQSTQIDENYKNNYEFTSNVIEIPQDVSVYVDKDKNVTIVNCPKKITVGDTFAVYENGVAQVYTAKGITVDGSDTVIVTNDVDIDKVTESVDAQGTEEGDLKQAEAVGDAQITYIEGGTEEQAYENGRAYRSRRRISGNKKISAVKASKKLELGAGKSFTINCTLSNVSVDYKINSGKREAYVKANGTAIITGKGEWDAVAAAGKSGSIELVKISVAYVGVITVTAEYSMNGEVTLTYTTGFQTGLQYSPQDGFRLTKDFQKKSFTLHSKTKLSAGVTASIGLVKLPVISGKIYAKMGAQTVIESETFDDGKSPKMCTTVSSWLYASAGANASLDFYVTKKSFSKTYDIFNENNSPVRLVYHFEDGHLIYPCSRGLASAKGYFTKWNSRYGSSWGGYGLDENGTPKPVFTYSLDDDGNATIIGYTGNVSALVIPDEIDGHKVIALGDNAFKGKKLLEYVEIPNNVVKIGSYVFANTSLTDLKLPEKLTYLGRCVLSGNTGVTEIVIPKTLATVGAEWENILAGDGPFHESNVQKATLEKGITSIPRNLFHKNTTLTQVTIPDTVTKIEEFAFAECGNLESVSLPDNVNQIGEYVFAKTGIKEINIPDTVTTIRDHTFKNCIALKNINWSKSITDIQSYAFENCDALTKLDIPNTVTNIGEGAFYECGGLSDIAVPNSVKSLGSRAFENCDALAKVSISDSVTSMGEKAFYDCDALTDVKLGTGITQIPTSCFEHCDALPSVVLPYRVSKVGDNAFKNCVALTEITIPRATTSISSSVFSYPAKMTVYGISGTYAETFANQQGMKFVNKAVKATNVVLDKTELTLNRGMKYSLTMTVTPATFTDEVSWKSTNVNVAAIAEDGTVTAKEAGQATIKVTVGDVSATCKVNVVQPVTSIYLNKTALEMTALDTYQLQASVYPSEANNKEVSWESSDEKVATVDKNGLVQAKEKGTAVITAKAKDGSEVSRNCKVTVKNTAYVVTDISKLESTHNYENNCSDFWVYTKTGASALNITFNSKTALEEDFDYLYVFDKENKQVGKYTGTQLAGKTITVSGDTVKIQLVSDDAGNAWGFKIDAITEKVEEECKHTDTTKREVRNAKAATCTLDGYSGDIYCTNCGNLIEAGSVTKAIGHQWDNGVITKAATATQTGIKTYTCTVCKITRTEVIKALGNNTKPIGNSNKPKLKTGEKITDKSTGAVYKVTGKNTVEYVKATSKKASRTIPSTVKLKGIRCQVTSIAAKAFKGDKKIKAVVIPSTVRKIGKEAFAKCKNLKKITIKTAYLSSKKVGANAFKGIHAKAMIKVPKKQKKAYQKLLRARGVGKKVTVK
nr:leucine-rich repeat protein [uncultured Anaerobutyricum sp.]